jgi:hypothetical protein
MSETEKAGTKGEGSQETSGSGEIRIIIRCLKDQKHAKKLRMNQKMGRDYAVRFGELICGTSDMFIHKPGPGSPFGKCGICGGQLSYELEEIAHG